MTVSRFIKGIRSLYRLGEVFCCFRKSLNSLKEIGAYLGLGKLKYPYIMKLKNGLSVRLDSWEDLTTAWVVFFGNEYTLADEDRVVVDLGANIGVFSLHAAYFLPEAKIFAVEPFPSTFSRLCDNVRANDLSDRIKWLNVASVGQSRMVYMQPSEGIPSHSRRTDATEGIEVEGLSLRDIIDRLEITHVNFLKIDIEGAEYEFFEKTPIEDLQCVDRIGLEYHGNGSTEKIFDVMQKAGFKSTRHLKKGTSGIVEFTRTKK